MMAVLVVALFGLAGGAWSTQLWPSGSLPGDLRTASTPTPTPAPPSPTPTGPVPGEPYSYRGPADLCTVEDFPAGRGEVLRSGSGFNEAVLSVEYALVALEYEGVTVDGILDDADVAALTRFQTDTHIIADGSLGQESWSKLRQLLTNTQQC